MNKIYMMEDEKRNFALIKIGFATNIDSRTYAYTTHNPLVQCISMVNTKETSKHKVEHEFQEEFHSMGYESVVAVIDGKKTEWFKVSYDDPFLQELETKGLNAFKCGRNRKNLGCFVKVKD